jgi:hypothetical protein
MSQVLELAQQGDTEAISALMNRHLKPQGVTAQVAKTQNALQIMLEGLDLPDQKRMTAFVTQGIQKLGLGSNVQIFGRQVGDQKPAWTSNFAISENGITPLEGIADVVGPGTAEFGAGDYKRMAKQGNPEAIQKFVEGILHDRPEMTPFVEYTDGVVKVTIQTTEFMDGQAFSSDFGNQMNEIASKQVREVELYKRKSEKTPPFLVKKMSLAAGGSVSAAPTPVHTEGNDELRPNGHSSAMKAPAMAGGAVGRGSMARPGEVTTIAVLLFISAGFSIALGITLILGVMAMAALMSQAGAEMAQAGITAKEAGAVAGVGAIVMVMACLPLLLGAGQITVGVGVLKMKKWAWYGALGFAVLAILTSVMDLLKFNIFAFFRISLNAKVIMSLINNSEAFEN